MPTPSPAPNAVPTTPQLEELIALNAELASLRHKAHVLHREAAARSWDDYYKGGAEDRVQRGITAIEADLCDSAAELTLLLNEEYHSMGFPTLPIEEEHDAPCLEEYHSWRSDG